MASTVLMIAFHFPPATMGSGHLRTLGFAKYLPSLGWSPIVLSACEQAYHRADPSSVNLIPDGCPVYRAFALDAKRHFGIRGKYLTALAQPDRWASWWPAAVYRGLRLISRHRACVIWSTYPIMTAHCIAYTLSRLTGLPWIADFRDPVPSSVATQSRLTLSTQMRCERRVLSQARYSVFTTPGAMRSYAERFPLAANGRRLTVIPNGFDEHDFAKLPVGSPRLESRSLHFVHGGVMYPSGRNPVPFFKALANLITAGALTEDDIHVTLRASGSETQYHAELERLGLTGIVTLAPPLPYHEALAEQATADALLLFQGSQYDCQIPAKLYEYLRLGRPIFALVGEHGDTAALLRGTAGSVIAPLDVVPVIEKKFMEFVRALRTGNMHATTISDAQRYSRQHAAKQLAELLNRISSDGGEN